MPVTRSKKHQRVSSEQSEPASNLAQSSKLELSNYTSRPKNRSEKLPSASDASPSAVNIAITGPKFDTSFTAPQEEPGMRSLRSRSYATSSNKINVSHTPDVELSKATSRSEKRSEQRRLKKPQSRSNASSNNNSSVTSGPRSDLSSFLAQEEPRMKSLRSRSYVSPSKNNTQAPAPKLDMGSYNPQEETAPKKIRIGSYINSTSKIVLPNTLEEMIYVPQEEVVVRKPLSNSSKSSRNNIKRAPSPASDVHLTSSHKDSQPSKKKVRLLNSATCNDAQTPEPSASNASLPRLEPHGRKLDPGSTLPEGNSTPSSKGIPTPFSESITAQVSENLSSPLSESKSAVSLEGTPTSNSVDKNSPLSKSNSALYSEDTVGPLSKSNYAPSPGPHSKKRAAPHPETSVDDISSSTLSNLKNHTPKNDSDDTKLTDEMSPEKQGRYRAEREKEPPRVAEQQKMLPTMDDFRKGFQDLLNHIRAPRKNSHNKKNPNEHMFALKLSPQLVLMAPSPRHVGIFMKDACSDSTSEAMLTWVLGLLMEVVKRDGLAWGEPVVESTEGGPVGKVSNWGFNPSCPHKLQTCFINTNLEILLCKKTFSAVITYHHQWKCAGQYEVPSGDMTDVHQTPRQSRTDRTTTGGGRSIQLGVGESGYGLGNHTPLAEPSFSHAGAAAFYLEADSHTVAGRHIAPSLADYLPANPYLSPYRESALPPPQPAYGGHVDFGDYLLDPALPTPPLHHHHFGPAAFDTPPHHPSSDSLYQPYQWAPEPTPAYLNAWTTPARPPSPIQVQQFMYPDPDIATESYVANWVVASLNLPLGPERGAVPFVPSLPAPVEPVVVAGPKKRVRKSRAKVRVAAAAAEAAPPPPTPTATAAMTMTEMTREMTPAPAAEPVVLGPSASETLAALQSAAASAPGVPVPAAYRHVWFLNGRGRVSKTRDNNPRCRRCRRRHWASCSRGQPCDECAKDKVPCVYGPGVGAEEEEEKGR